MKWMYGIPAVDANVNYSLQELQCDARARKEGIYQKVEGFSNVGKVQANCHIPAHKVRGDKGRHLKPLPRQASWTDNGGIPEHGLGYAAQCHVFFYRRHISKVTAILYARLSNPPDAVSEFSRVMTRSSTRLITILHAYAP